MRKSVFTICFSAGLVVQSLFLLYGLVQPQNAFAACQDDSTCVLEYVGCQVDLTCPGWCQTHGYGPACENITGSCDGNNYGECYCCPGM
jgi:hypothetical protein